MACCKCCCGGEDCEEGQEGKCCCGGSSGTCCDVGEYCCDGVCSEEPCSACGANCPETLSVTVSVAGYSGSLDVDVVDGIGSYDDPNVAEGDYFSFVVTITCAVVDGVAVWTVSVAICWKNGNDVGSEQWDGTVTAGQDGCPPTGSVTMTCTFGNGDATVTASFA